MVVVVSLGLAGVLVYLSFTPAVSSGLGRLLPFLGGTASSFAVMSIGFFFLRFLGQGSLTLVSRNVVMEWFEKRRGMANAILGVAVSFGFSYSPRVFDRLIQSGGWQGAWRFLAVIIGAGFCFTAFMLFRDKPEDFGLSPDGGAVKTRKVFHPETEAGKNFTLQEARRSFSYWIFILALTVASLTVTAFTFHVVSIFGEAGLPRTQAVAIFPPFVNCSGFSAVFVELGKRLHKTEISPVPSCGGCGAAEPRHCSAWPRPADNFNHLR